MNVTFHIIFGILATAFFLWQYTQTKFTYQLLFALWIPSTFLTYVSPNKTFQLALGICELILFFLVLFFLFRNRSQRRAQEIAQQKMASMPLPETAEEISPIIENAEEHPSASPDHE